MRKSVEQTTDMHCFFNVPQNLNFLAGQDGQDIKKNGSQSYPNHIFRIGGEKPPFADWLGYRISSFSGRPL